MVNCRQWPYTPISSFFTLCLLLLANKLILWWIFNNGEQTFDIYCASLISILYWVSNKPCTLDFSLFLYNLIGYAEGLRSRWSYMLCTGMDCCWRFAHSVLCSLQCLHASWSFTQLHSVCSGIPSLTPAQYSVLVLLGASSRTHLDSSECYKRLGCTRWEI